MLFRRVKGIHLEIKSYAFLANYNYKSMLPDFFSATIFYLEQIDISTSLRCNFLGWGRAHALSFKMVILIVRNSNIPA